MAAKKTEKPKKAPAKGEKPKAPAKPREPALTTARLELSYECGRCMQPVVPSRLSEPQTCRACLHTWSFAAPLWASMRGGFAEALKRGRGSRRFGAALGPEHKASVCVEAERARCPCGAEIDEDALVAGLGIGVACACGRTMNVRAPDDLVLAIAPSARAVANERDEPPLDARPVAFRCACGATLRADGLTRSVVCASCGAVDVPTPLWHVLRPVRPRAPFFFVLGKASR